MAHDSVIGRSESRDISRGKRTQILSDTSFSQNAIARIGRSQNKMALQQNGLTTWKTASNMVGVNVSLPSFFEDVYD